MSSPATHRALGHRERRRPRHAVAPGVPGRPAREVAGHDRSRAPGGVVSRHSPHVRSPRAPPAPACGRAWRAWPAGPRSGGKRPVEGARRCRLPPLSARWVTASTATAGPAARGWVTSPSAGSGSGGIRPVEGARRCRLPPLTARSVTASAGPAARSWVTSPAGRPEKWRDTTGRGRPGVSSPATCRTFGHRERRQRRPRHAGLRHVAGRPAREVAAYDGSRAPGGVVSRHSPHVRSPRAPSAPAPARGRDWRARPSRL